MTRTGTGINAVKAVTRAFTSALRLADSDEKQRELLILGEMIYLQLACVNAGLAEAFYEAQGKATTEPRHLSVSGSTSSVDP